LGEFEVPSAADSCFFFVSETSIKRPASNRIAWTWEQAGADCASLGGQLASLASLDEVNEVRAVIAAGTGAANVNNSVWVGASTQKLNVESDEELAASFTWLSGEAWAFGTPLVDPWGTNQPDTLAEGQVTEGCVEMRAAFQYRFNNLACATSSQFLLCERAK
jgi:hypothetical protein